MVKSTQNIIVDGKKDHNMCVYIFKGTGKYNT